MVSGVCLGFFFATWLVAARTSLQRCIAACIRGYHAGREPSRSPWNCREGRWRMERLCHAPALWLSTQFHQFRDRIGIQKAQLVLKSTAGHSSCYWRSLHSVCLVRWNPQQADWIKFLLRAYFG
jgi:hypothetical protein